MSKGSFPRVVDQVVETLREGMLGGRWRGSLPGRDRLAIQLGISHVTMEKAMRQLAKEGLLVSDGVGRRRRIVVPDKAITPKHYRLRILPYEPLDRSVPYVSDLMERLSKAGFSADFSLKSLLDLGMDVKRVARHVQQYPADAWIVIAGSREVLQWFCEQSIPTYAYFGNKSGIPIAGCGVRNDVESLVKRLADSGHRRIVLLTREDHVVPVPSLFSKRFLQALESVGIEPGSYHLPVWGYRPDGLHRCLESLFKVSPPTALLATEAPIMLATQNHLARRGIISPRDVSLVCHDYDASFNWFDPKVTHYTWDPAPISRHVLRWAKAARLGREDKRQTVSMAHLVEGGTIGPAPDLKARA